MKTIQVTDEMYDRLMGIAQEIDTQNNRATAKPYFFQVQTEKRVTSTDPTQYDDRVAYYDGDEYPVTIEGVKEFCECNDRKAPKNVDKFDTYDIQEFFEQEEFQLGSFTVVHEYQNAFLTESACRKHIELNHYHYRNGVDYLSHAFRNPDLELVFEFLESLIKQEEPV